MRTRFVKVEKAFKTGTCCASVLFLYIYILETNRKVDEWNSGYVIGSCPTLAVGVAYESYSIVDGRDVAYRLIMRPSGVNKQSAFIQ